MAGVSLQTGNTKSCGCWKREATRNTGLAARTHGHSRNRIRTRTYKSWAAMRQRTTDPNCRDYKNYGGRGIAVCERWRSFERFLEDMGERPEGLTIDRIDVDGNYEPGNCRWATTSQQNRNQRRWNRRTA